MKKLLLILLFLPMIGFGQNYNGNDLYAYPYDSFNDTLQWAIETNDGLINYPSHRPFISESYIDAIDNFSNYIKLNQTCYHEIPKLHSDYSIPLRAPFCCSTIHLIDFAYYIRGEVFYYLGKYEKAIADFNKAIELGEGAKIGYYFISRGYVHLTKGNYEKAIIDFSSIIMTSTGSYYPYELRAEAYYYTDQFDKCISDLTQAINNYSIIDDDLYIKRGDCYALNENFENAMSDYRKAIRLNPNNSLSHYRKGLLLERWELDPCKEYQKACELGYDQECEFYSTTKWFCQ